MIAGEIDINDVARNTVVGTIKVRGVRRFNLRIKVATMLVRLAAWVAPFRMDVEDE